ncbi:hypothetical protein [Pedobacter sp. ASV28]|uniref:hypothetical protein n=1 Tax=Pedobacter sp. ASV28 TaxID=2795123 RepID=UPI0018EDF0C9|nr:hypothetical protein [Pedobacter sp. ASV28]
MEWSVAEENLIKEAFRKNKIGRLKGEIVVADGIVDMPADFFMIFIIGKGKRKAQVMVYKNYKATGSNKEMDRIADFKNTIEITLNKNKSYKKVLDSTLTYAKENRIFAL